MKLSLDGKKAVVADVAEVAAQSISVIAAEYRGLTVTEMTELRQKARAAGVHLKVVRNTLTKRAFKGTEFECINDHLTGPLCLAFATQAPSDAARVLREFVKTHEKLVVRAISLNGQVLDASALSAVAELPTKDEAIAKLMYVMKAPIEKFVRTLIEPVAQVVRCTAAIRDQKQTAAA